MSVSIDEKIVELKFDNKQFEKGCAQSIETMDKLNKAADFKQAAKGFEDFQQAADSVKFDQLQENVAGLARRFSALGVAGMTVIQDITNRAINMGRRLGTIFAAPLNQIKSGGISRALNLEQAEFQIEGLGKSWKKLQEDINYGVQDTAYGLDAAAKAAAQLSASQVEAGDDMKAALRGISGVAAMTNSSYEDISNIFTTVAGNGRLMSEQLLQLSSRGINAAATLGEQLGKTEAEIRDMVSKGQIDFATFSKAMDDAFGQHAKDANKTFEGSISNVKAALSKIGALFAMPITKEAIGPINAFRESLNAFKAVLEEKGGLGEQFAKVTKRVANFINTIMTDEMFLKSITKTTKGFVEIIRFLGQIFKPIATAFQQIFPPSSLDNILDAAKRFKQFAENLQLSGENADRLRSIARGVFSAFKIFLNVMGLIRDVIFDILSSGFVSTFLLKAGAAIGDVVTIIGQFVTGLRTLYKTASSTFGGIGGIFSNLGEVGKAFGVLIANTLGRIIPLFKVFGESAEDGVGKAGEAFSKVGSIFSNVGNAIKAVFKTIGDLVVRIFGPVKDKIMELVGKLPNNFKNMVDSITDIFKRGDKVAENSVMVKVLNGITLAIKIVMAIIVKLGEVVRDVFASIVKHIGSEGLGNVIEQALSIGILMSLKRFVTRFMKISVDLKSLTGTFTGLLTEVKYSLISFQRNMQTTRILELSIAIGLLAGALLLLSTINPEGMTTGLAGLAGATTLLVAAFGAMRAFDKDGKGLGKFGFQMVEFAIAISIMASALKKLADLDIKQIAIGLAGLAGAMVIMVAAVKVLGNDGKRIMKGALQLIFLAQAVKMLAGVVVTLSGMKWEALGKGLAGLAGVLLEIALFARIVNRAKIRITTATAMIIMAQAIIQLMAPMKELGAMDWKTLGTGLGALGAILGEIAIFSALMSKLGRRMGVFKATGIYILVEAITNIIGAVKTLGSMNIDILKKGLSAVGAIMLEMAVFSTILSLGKGMLIKAAAITILVKTLSELVNVVKAFGNVNVDILGTGLKAMAIAIVEVALALALVGKGSLKSAVSFSMVAGAIKVLAASLALLSDLDKDGLGNGLTAIVTSVIALAAAVRMMKGATLGAAAMVLVASSLLILAPALAIMGNMPLDNMMVGLVGLAGAMLAFVVAGKAAQACVPGILALSGGLAVLGVSFLAFGAGVLLFGMGVNTLVGAVTRIADLGNKVVESGVAIGKGLGEVIINMVKKLFEGAKVVAKAIVEFIIKLGQTIIENAPRLVKQAYELILAFINGLAAGAKKYLPKIMDAIGNLMKGIIEGLKSWFEQFSELGTATVGKIIAAVLMVIALFRLLSASVAKIKPGSMGGAIAMVAGIVVLVTSLVVLAQIPWKNLISAATALSLTIASFGVALGMMSKIKINGAQVAMFLLAALSLVEIGGALALAAMQPWQSVLAAGFSIALVLKTYTECFKAVSKMQFTPATIVNLTMFAAGTLALVPIVVALKVLASEDWASLLSAATSISAVLLSYSAVFVLMGKLPLPMAIAAVANLAIAIGGITAIIALMGAISQIPGFTWLVGEGGKLLLQIGDILGGFIGSIIAGVGKALSSLLPQLGSDLSAFMVNATPFFVGMEMIDDSIISATVSLAGAILALTGAELLSGIASLLGADFSNLGDKLAEFADGVVIFADKTKDLDGQKVESAAAAASLLAKLAGDIPLEGGLLGALIGDHIPLDEFGSRLPALAKGIMGFADEIKGLDTASVETAANAASLLVKLSGDVPLEGGLLGALIGDHIPLDVFGERLPALGTGLKKFSENVAGLSMKDVEQGATAASMMIELSKGMPTTGGLIGLITGNPDGLDEFGNRLPDLGKGLKAFADNVVGMDVNAATNAATVAEMLTALANNVPDSGGLASWFAGDNTLDDFGEQLPEFGEYIKEFSDKVTGMDVGAVSVAAQGISGVVKMMEIATTNNVSPEDIATFGSNIRQLGSDYKQFAADTLAASVTGPEQFKTGVETIVDAIKKINKVDTSKVKSFFDNTKGLTTVGVSDITKSAEDSVDGAITALKNKKADFEKVGRELMNSLKAGMNNNKKAISAAAGAIAAAAQLAIRQRYPKFRQAGEYLGDGFINGVADEEHKSGAAKAGEELANAALEGIRKEADIHSPSKKAKKHGKNTAKGYSEGVKDKSAKAEANAGGADLANSALAGINSKQSAFADAGTVAGGNFVTNFFNQIKNSGLTDKYGNTDLGLKDAKKDIVGKNEKDKKDKDKKDKKDKKTTTTPVTPTTTTDTSGGSGGGGGGSTKKEETWTEKDAKKALSNYKLIVGSFVKNSKKLEKEFVKIKSSKVFGQFKKEFNNMEKGLGKSLSKISSVVVTYAKNHKKATDYAKSTVKAFNKIYGGQGNKYIGNYAQRLYEASDQYKQDIKNAKKLNKEHNKNIKEATELHNKIKNTSNKKLKKKYAEELAQLRKDDKALLKELNKQVKAIEKGPAKALKAAKKSLVESYKSFIDISNWDIAPRFDLSGFDALKDTSAKFSIFGDIAEESSQAFNMFSVSMTKSIDEVVEAFDALNVSIDTGMNLFERFIKTGTVEKEALIENADSQLEAYEEFYNGIEALRSKGFNDELVDDLESQGPQVMNYVRGFLNMSDSEVEGYNDRINKKYEWEAKVLEKNMKKQLTQYEKFNAQIEELAARGLSEGIINKLKQSGVSQAAYVQAMLHMDTATMNSVQDIYLKSLEHGETEVAAEGKKYGLTFLEAIKQEIQFQNAWDDKLDELAERGVREEIIDQFAEMGEAQAGAYVDSLLEETDAGLKEVNDLYDQYIVTTTKSFLEAAQEQKDAREKYESTMAEFRKVAAENGLNPEVIRAIESMAEEDAEAYAKSIIANVADIPKINELYLESGAASVDQMTRNIVSQYEAADEYNSDLDKALAKIGKDEKGIYTKYLKDMGMEGAEYVKALANATEEQIAKFRTAIDEREKRNQEERARATMEAYKKQIDGINNYESNLQKLVERGASRKLVESIAKIAETDPLGASERIEDLLSLAPDQFASLNEQYTQAMKKDITKVVDEIFADYAAAGTKIVNQNAQNVQTAKDGVTAMANGMSAEAIANAQKIMSAGEQMGTFIGNGAVGKIKTGMGKEVIDTTIDQLSGKLSDDEAKVKFFTIGETITTGIMQGIEQNSEGVKKKAKRTAIAIHDKFSDNLSIEKGSNIAKRFSNKGIKQYFDSNGKPVKDSAGELAEGIYNKVANKLSKANGNYIAQMFLEGLIEGLADKKKQLELERKASNIAGTIVDTINDRAKIESPSKVMMWSGRMFVEGLAAGLNDSQGKVQSASERLAESAMTSLQETLSKVSEGVNTEIDFNPVITPRLDLSKVTAQARSINSMIDGQRIGAVLRAEEETKSQNQNQPVTYNFEQNNYSPKALSREEIYRQTNNQFAMARKAVRSNDILTYGY